MYFLRATIVHMPERKRGDFLTELLTFAAFALVIVIPVRMFIAQPFVVSGRSMDPTFENGQYLIIDELSYRFQEPTRGEVIVFRYPKNPKEFFIKRIIGLPGETVEIRNGRVIVWDGGEQITLDEPYIVNTGNGTDITTSLGDDEYFVMGDNRPESSDSRVWGVLPRDDITGRVFLRLLPLDTAGLRPGSTESPQR